MSLVQAVGLDFSTDLAPHIEVPGEYAFIRRRATFLGGARLSEFGAKPNASRFELPLRYSF